jgi:exosortase/archaeosortase family protein
VNKNKLLRTFIVRALIVFVCWQILYVFVIEPYQHIDNWLTDTVVYSTVAGLNVFGFESFSIESVIYINGQQSVLVGNACNGLELLALYVGFLICFPGGLLSKIVYSIIGSFLIWLINVFREILLALNYNYFQATFDINHKYTYTLVVYVFVFLLWKHWLSRYSILAQN